MGQLNGKIAVITGAARGQGAEEARLFASEGATVVLADVDDAAGKELADQLPGGAVYRHHDVTEEDSWQDLASFVQAEHGRLDVLVNNAGIYRTAPFADTPVADLDLLYQVNQRGVFLGMQAAVEPMRAAGGGSIVNVASAAVLKATPGVLAYAATKWAVRGMSRNAALELAALNIRVNAIHPGIIDTPMLAANPPEAMEAFAAMTPLSRMGRVADVAHLALFLAGDQSSFVTGGDFTVDGGITL